MEDVAVLEQRLLLQRRQWQELQHQVEARNELVTVKLAQWADFGQRCRHLIDVMNKLEQRICDNQEFSIEELLEKLDKVFLVISIYSYDYNGVFVRTICTLYTHS